jgi:hypothetical protein
MGYESLLSPDSFFSKFTAEEVTEKYDAFRQNLRSSAALQKIVGDDGSYLDEYYLWTCTDSKGKPLPPKDGLYLISLECEGDDYNGKHYSDRSLAFFISTVIAPGKTCEILFEGEDNECWGFEIGYLSVGTITKVWRNNDDAVEYTEKELAQALLSS